MVSFATFAVAVAGFASAAAIAIDLPQPLERRQGQIAVQNWSNENAVYKFTSGSAGKFTVDWNNRPGGNFVAGKGYRAQNMLFNYTGTFQVNGNAYLALYGWTKNPLVEYYIMESFGSHNPSDNANSTYFGKHESDGGTYELWMKWRVNAPSIVGDATFPQYWSVRTKNHCGGTINTGNHFRAWTAAGLPLGALQNMNMFMAIEGQAGIGSANITVGVAPTTVVPETTTATIRTERRTTTTSRRVTTTPVLTTTRSSTALATTSSRTTTPIPSSTISTTRSTALVTTLAITSVTTTVRTTTRATTSTTRRRCPWC